jgi:hypothetical protein
MQRFLRAGASLALCVAFAAAAADSVVQSFTGTGGRTTRPFVVADEWELQWEAKGGLFQVYLLDSNGAVVDLAVNQPSDGSGSSYVRKGGRYHLQINALGAWTLRVVEIDRPASPK